MTSTPTRRAKARRPPPFRERITLRIGKRAAPGAIGAQLPRPSRSGARSRRNRAARRISASIASSQVSARKKSSFSTSPRQALARVHARSPQRWKSAIPSAPKRNARSMSARLIVFALSQNQLLLLLRVQGFKHTSPLWQVHFAKAKSGWGSMQTNRLPSHAHPSRACQRSGFARILPPSPSKGEGWKQVCGRFFARFLSAE